MEWVTNLEGQVVGIDTAPIIYLIQENPRYLATVRPFFEAIDRGECQSVTSAVTLIEVLIHPLRQESPNLANQYRNILLHSNGLACIPISLDIAEAAAQLRADYNIRTPDAIHRMPYNWPPHPTREQQPS